MHNPLYSLVHRYYLSKRFSLSQRVRAAMSHHEYEQNNTTKIRLTCLQLVPCFLWSYLFEGFTFAIKLIATEHVYEGELSVILFVDELYCVVFHTVILIKL